MNKLQEIVLEKRKQVGEDKQLVSVELLKKSNYFKRECASLKEYILRKDKSGIITEIKKKSPALGAINPSFSQIIRRHFYFNPITNKDFYVVHPHFS